MFAIEEGLTTSNSIYISNKAHLNLTFNLCECGVSELLPVGRLTLEKADTFTMLYMNKGAALLETEGLAFKVLHPCGFVTFPDERYELMNISDEPVDIVWLSFTGYQVEHYLGRANIFRAKPVFADPDGQLGEKLNRIYQASQRFPNRYCRMMSTLYDIFSFLLDANPTKNVDGFVDNSSFYAVRAVDFIERNYAMDISINDIAEVLGISRKHLYEVFGQELKISPKQYLISYRIEKACIRLKSTSQSVLEVAESVGYANQFYFTKEFKRLTGKSPTEYRKDRDISEIFSYRTFSSTLKGQAAAAVDSSIPPSESLETIRPQKAKRSEQSNVRAKQDTI